ncbi:uncharacterized protein LOC102803179 [Saccoglossus kowalevskii]|uniref:Uncharacterized protein LOC102803179 n=1 Tax=Saccoglossus kowalevskii TaxID=10224 RepID=A0ABM0M235_SACKO|nr:PREDICTED: uncharacterized protein LOC102803179 [Saccoglossus kowalevskii]
MEVTVDDAWYMPVPPAQPREDIAWSFTPPPTEKTLTTTKSIVPSLPYDALKISQLKMLCRERFIPVTGRKAELIGHLELLDLSDDDLKVELDKHGLFIGGSKPGMVRRLVQAKRKEKRRSLSISISPHNCHNYIPRQLINPWDVEVPMECGGCGKHVPNSDKLSHLDGCWFTSDGSPDVHLFHAKSPNWAGKFEIYISVPLHGSFKDIDMSLRFTWMQCCLSTHSRNMELYTHSNFQKDPAIIIKSTKDALECTPGSTERPLETELHGYLQDDDTIMYDYGSTDDENGTPVTVEHLGKRRLRPPHTIYGLLSSRHVIMRNNMPVIPCMRCSMKSSFVVGIGCGQRFFCSRLCCEFIGHRAEELKPFLNSPRSGSCDYHGFDFS